MAQLQITIDLDNAALEEAPELARILRIIANTYYNAKGRTGWQTVHDINGNPVGRYRLDKGAIPLFS